MPTNTPPAPRARKELSQKQLTKIWQYLVSALLTAFTIASALAAISPQGDAGGGIWSRVLTPLIIMTFAISAILELGFRRTGERETLNILADDLPSDERRMLISLKSKAVTLNLVIAVTMLAWAATLFTIALPFNFQPNWIIWLQSTLFAVALTNLVGRVATVHYYSRKG